MNIEEQIKSAIKDVKDFPKSGIVFKDLTPLLLNPDITDNIINEFIQQLNTIRIDAVCAIESRGFLYGMLLASRLHVPFIPVRKKGKLPGETIQYTYDLEYGTSTVEVHLSDIKAGWNVLIHDDLLATGGTAIAASELMKMRKANVAAYAFVVELTFLHGSEKLRNYSDKIISLAQY